MNMAKFTHQLINNSYYKGCVESIKIVEFYILV